MLDCEVENFDHLVQEKISKVLQYSAQYWAQHLTDAGNVKAEDSYINLKYFLTKQLLFWIEVMNLIGAKGQHYSLLQDAQQWLLKVCANFSLTVPDIQSSGERI